MDKIAALAVFLVVCIGFILMFFAAVQWSLVRLGLWEWLVGGS